MKTAPFVLALIIIAASSALAQSSADVVKASGALSVDKVKQGATVKAAVVVNISQGYHINSNRPLDKFLIPAALKIEPLSGATASAVIYPPASMRKFPFSKTPMSVFEGRAIIRFTLRALPSLAPGNYTLRAKLTVQACNDQACLPPKTLDVSIPFEVVPATAQVNNINGDLFGAPRRGR